MNPSGTPWIHADATDVLAAMPAALLVVDGEGALRTANLAAAALLGRDLDELDGLRLSDIVDGDAGELARLVSERGAVRVERSLVARGGARVPVLLSATRHAGGMVCIAMDIRDRKQLEVELRGAQKLEAVGRLAAGIAHEINTPVQFVSDSLHFVREAVVDLCGVVRRGPAVQPDDDPDLAYVLENAPKAIDRALDGLDRVATLVRSLKEFAHPDEKEMGPVDLNRAIRSTLTVARNELRYVADVETDLAELPMVMCHAGDVNQALLNIVVNAAHAIADVVKGSTRRGRIHVVSRREGDDVVISVSDTGAGIPEAVRELIFDPFFTTKEAGRGTGQGLAIARNVIVEKHAGTLTFDTEVGKGTTFRLRLPIAPALRVAAAATT